MNSTNQAVSSVIKNYSDTQNAFLSRSVVIPLIQEYGVSYRNLVKPGDIVTEGEKIAVSEGQSPNPTYIHASVPGTVTDIIPCMLQNGKQDFGIKIKFGGSFSYLGKKIPEQDLSLVPSSSIADTLNEEGVINCFYTIRPESLGRQIKEKRECECIAVRLFDEDPYRITDSLVARFNLEKIVKGAQAIAKALGAKGILLAIDQKVQNKAELKKIETDSIKLLEMNIKRYPCGTPREMVSAFSRSALKKSCNFSFSKKDLFVDASAVLAAYNAVYLKMPYLSQNVHFSGNCLYASCLLNVKLGTPIKDVVAQMGGFSKMPSLVIINGNLGGSSVQSLDMPVTKDIKSVKFISSRKLTDEQIYSCVNCGLCRSICPVKIAPDLLYNSIVSAAPLPPVLEDTALICNSCGLCNTVCQARLPLVQTITVLRQNKEKK